MASLCTALDVGSSRRLGPLAALSFAVALVAAGCGISQGAAVPDATPIDAAADTTADTSADTTPPDASDATPADASGAPLAVPAELIDLACQSFCQSSGATCGFAALGGSQAACEGACAALAAEDGWWLASYVCYAGSCDASLCALDGPPLGPQADCELACAALDQCDLLSVFELPEDQPELCRAACAGQAAAAPATAETYACIIDALGPTCDAAALATCAPAAVDPLCATFCAPPYDAAGPAACPADSALRTTWPAVDACVAACGTVGLGAPTVRFGACLQANGCADPAPCLALPPTDPAPCADACAAMLTLCGGFGGLTDPAVCVPFCGGVFGLLPVAPSPTAGECVAQSACPDGDDARVALWYQCLVPQNPDCTPLCDRLDACKASFDPNFDAASCKSGCNAGYLGAADHVTAIAACASAEACAAVTSCFPPAPGTGDALCQPMCDHLADDCGAPFDPQCHANCTASFATGAEAYAVATCRLAAPCDAQAACDPLATAAVPEPCATACAASPLTCGSAARCLGTCAGLLAAGPLTPADATCIVNTLGFGCDPAAPLAQCPAP